MQAKNLEKGFSIFGNKGNVWNDECHIKIDGMYSTLCGTQI